MKVGILWFFVLILTGCSAMMENKFFDFDRRYVLTKSIQVGTGSDGYGTLPKGTVVYQYSTPAEGAYYYALININDASVVEKLAPEGKVEGLGFLEAFEKKTSEDGR